MDNKREIERAELHKTIWAIANDLRGSIDGWDFKQYVIGFLFYRFISENITNYINLNQKKAGFKDFDYLNISDDMAENARAQIVDEKGLFILPSELFKNVCLKYKDDENLNVKLDNVFKNIEASATGTESENNIKGLFDDIDVNSKKLGKTVVERNKKLGKLLDAIDGLKLGEYYNNEIDAFGDTYEYLMTMYAADAGKSGGEFFTPQEVSELLTKLSLIDFSNPLKGFKTEVNKVYDPACGSGSLLLKFAKILGKDNVKEGFFGQEINLTTYNLARINMFLHDVNYEKFNIAYGDTLTSPQHWDDQPFEAIVSNPPYSIKWEGKSNPLLINDERFSPAGILAPEGKADLAFVMHILSWLSSNGTAAIIEYPGILSRGNAEQKIRQYLVDNNYVDSVIQMPGNLFYGNSIVTCVIVLRKNKTNNKVLFVDASKQFVKVDTKNKLLNCHIDKIVNTVMNKSLEEEFSKLVDYEDIVDKKYNLSVGKYIIKSGNIDDIDIEEVNSQIETTLIREDELREQINSLIMELDGDNNE